MLLKLRPACKDYIWGGDRLKTNYHIPYDGERLAESWMLSCHPDGPSVVENGPFAGRTLADYLAAHPDATGTGCAGFNQFPILIKLIDAKENLSVQVHPSDHYAQAHEGQYGKTEMWVVIDCEPDACLYYGFRRPVSREEFAQRIQDNTLLEVLNAVPVHKGDVFFIPAGTLHAIGKGIVIAEVQQNSNVTYRVYDYGRIGADGKPRALHISQALEVTDLNPPAKQAFGTHLASCPYFTVDRMAGNFTDACGDGSFTSLLVLEGSGLIQSGADIMPLKKGDSIFLPAGAAPYAVRGKNLTLLRTRTGAA